MSIKYLKRFSNVKALQRITPEYLIDFLLPYDDWLKKHGFNVNEKNSDGDLNYKKFQSIFIDPPEDMPSEFVESIFKICEVGCEDNYDKLKTHADLKKYRL